MFARSNWMELSQVFLACVQTFPLLKDGLGSKSFSKRTSNRHGPFRDGPMHCHGSSRGGVVRLAFSLCSCPTGCTSCVASGCCRSGCRIHGIASLGPMTWLMLRSCWPECQEASAPRSWAWWCQFQRRMAWPMVRLLLSLLLPWLASLRQWTLARPCTTASTQPSSRLPRARVPSLPSWSASLRTATEQLRALFMDGLATASVKLSTRGTSQSGMCGWE